MDQHSPAVKFLARPMSRAMTLSMDVHRRPQPNGANQQIRDEIERRMNESPHHELRQIQIDVRDNQIVLTGRVASYFLKQMAQETARQVCHRRQIRNTVIVLSAESQ
jgi:hypothetical protein